MHVGLKLPQIGEGVDRGAVRGFCQSAEDLGFDSLWIQDHVFYPLSPSTAYGGFEGISMPDQYRRTFSALELLSMAAAWTERVRLGTHVMVAGSHHPVQLAQRLATIDVLSEGRLVVGLGVGWSSDEHRLLGVPFERRGQRFDEFIETLLACWAPDPVEHHGSFFDVPPSAVGPKPLQHPHPPLLVGFLSPNGVARAVRWFDGWMSVCPMEEAVDRLADMNSSRAQDQRPLTLHTLGSPYSPHLDEGVVGVDGVMEQVLNARKHGADEIIIECAYWPEITRSQDWVAVPQRLAAVVEAAHG